MQANACAPKHLCHTQPLCRCGPAAKVLIQKRIHTKMYHHRIQYSYRSIRAKQTGGKRAQVAAAPTVTIKVAAAEDTCTHTHTPLAKQLCCAVGPANAPPEGRGIAEGPANSSSEAPASEALLPKREGDSSGRLRLNLLSDGIAAASQIPSQSHNSCHSQLGHD